MFHCPWILMAQAKQEVDKRDDPTPMDRDVEWTNNAQESSDVMISLVRPAKYPEKMTEGYSFHGITMKTNYLNQLMLVRLNKHKTSQAPWDHWVFFDVTTNSMRHQNPFKTLNLNG